MMEKFPPFTRRWLVKEKPSLEEISISYGCFQSRAKSMVSILHYNKQRYSFFLQDMVDNLRAQVQEMLMFSKQKRFMIGSVIFVQWYFHHVHMLMVVMFLHQKQTQNSLDYRYLISLALSLCRQEVPVRSCT